MPPVFDLMKKPLGKVLEEAGLIHEGQLQVVLMEQNIYPHLKIGEILALHCWIKQETADFFADKMRQLIKNETFDLQIGNFFYLAGLLSKKDIKNILTEQKKTGIKFGSTAVLKGLIKKQTLDFYLNYFTFETNKNTDFQYKDKDTLTQKKLSLQDHNNQANVAKNTDKYKTLTTYLFTYYERAVVYFTKARSVSTNSEKLEHLQTFLKLYRKIEKLQKQIEELKIKDDAAVTIKELPMHAQDQLDKIYVWVLAQLQNAE